MEYIIAETLTEIVEKSAYSEAQLNGYDHFWDEIRTSEMFYADARKDGLEQGREEGMQKGLEKGREEGAEETKKAIVEKMKAGGFDAATIAEMTGLTKEEVEKL